MINFILHNQDYDLPIAVLVSAIDFSKAFNRINHNLIITKLADMGVPGWLLNIVMGFLEDRTLLVRFNGGSSESKVLPGGGPQGTLQIRCVLEYGVPVWNSSITKEESVDIERVQKAFLHIALQDQYTDYKTALKIACFDSLEDRRLNLCITFAK